MKTKIAKNKPKLSLLLLAASSLIMGGCKSPMGAGSDEAASMGNYKPICVEKTKPACIGANDPVVKNPLIGKWRAIEQSARVDARTAAESPNKSSDTTLECRADGTLILSNVERSSEYHWRHGEHNMIIVETKSDGAFYPVMRMEMKGNELILDNQGGRTRFTRTK